MIFFPICNYSRSWSFALPSLRESHSGTNQHPKAYFTYRCIMARIIMSIQEDIVRKETNLIIHGHRLQKKSNLIFQHLLKCIATPEGSPWISTYNHKETPKQQNKSQASPLSHLHGRKERQRRRKLSSDGTMPGNQSLAKPVSYEQIGRKLQYPL